MKHPQTGADVDKWDCADAWAPLLQVAIVQAVDARGLAMVAETEALRNEVAGRGDALIGGAVKLAQHTIAGAMRASDPTKLIEG